MRSLLKLIFLVMACVLLGAQGIAISESAATVPPLRHILEISFEVTPDELIESGDVTLSFSMRNDSNFVANDLYLTSATGNYTESLGQLLPGEERTFVRTYAVSDSELEEGRLSFIVSHADIVSEDGEAVTYSLDAIITRMDPTPDIEFTRQISPRHVAPGESVVLTYRVRNSGNVPLTQVKVSDSLGGFTGSVELLDPGATKIFSSSVTVNGEAISEATVSYLAPSVSDDAVSVKLDKVVITGSESTLTTALTVDRETAAVGDTVNGVITIAADGGDFTDIVVIDDVYHNVIADTLEVADGNSLTITCSWPVRGPSDYRVRVEATDRSGKRVEVYTETASVSFTGEFARTALSLSANAQTPEINRAGKTRINVAIVNSGNVSARDVVLREKTLGEVRRFEFVAAGEPTMRSVVVDVLEDTVFEFALTYTGIDGIPVEVQCEPVSVSIASGGADPIAEAGDNGRKPYELSDTSRYFWMIGIGSAALLVLIIILIVSHDRERRDRKRRQERERQRRKNAPKPVRKGER